MNEKGSLTNSAIGGLILLFSMDDDTFCRPFRYFLSFQARFLSKWLSAFGSRSGVTLSGSQ